MLPQASLDFYRAQQRLTVATVATMRRIWSQMGPSFETSWRVVGPRLTMLLASAQLASARNGANYVDAVLAETRQTADPAGDVIPRRFAGTASDGRALDSLLYGAVVTSGQAFNAGATQADALSSGAGFLDVVAWTQVADAARGGTSVGIAARPHVTGYVRMLNPPSCARCAVLAGRYYRWNRGFLRHPRCDCVHIPAAEDMAGDFRTDPQAVLADGQVTGLTAAQQQAIDDGADFGRVVNSRRNMAATRVEEVYRRSTSRAQVIKALQRLGYIT